MFDNGFYIEIILGVILGFLLDAAFREAIDYLWVYRKSDFTGYWKSSVFDASGAVIKVDYIHLKHNPKNGVIKGNIIRNQPHTQSDRRWRCNGVLRDEKIIMSFWSTNSTIKSDGSGYLFLIADRTFKGIYMHGTVSNTIETADVMSVKIIDPTEIKRIRRLMR